MPEPFEPLREALLRAGAAPSHVRRYLRELSEHLCDLTEAEINAGRSAAEAQAAARARLGGDEALAEAMLAEPSLRSWTGRAPWATLVIGPILMLVLAWFLACLGLILMFTWLRHANGLFQPPTWSRLMWAPQGPAVRIGVAVLDLVQVGGPLLIASWAAWLSARQRSRLVWPLLGCAAVALLGDSLVWNAAWPDVDPRNPLHPTSWSISLGIRGTSHVRGVSFSFADWSHGLPLVALSLAIATAVYWMTRSRTPAAV
jgi:hypothetical protein